MLFGAGLFAGFAAFTKNEGIVFAIALPGVVAVMWRAAIVPVPRGVLPGLGLRRGLSSYMRRPRNI